MRRLRQTMPSGAAMAVLAAMTLVGAIPATAQEPNLDEVGAYMAWYTANSAGDAAKAAEAGRAYLEKFPTGEHAEYVRKWMVGVQWTQFQDAIKKKDMAEMIRIGQERLKQDPKDLGFLYWMALNLRQNELLAPGEAAHAKEAADFARRSIELIEAGGQPTGVDAAKWNKDANLAWLHQALAMVAAKEGRSEDALKEYELSSGLAGKDAALLARNHLGCGSLHKSLYDAAVAQYQGLPEAERAPASPGPAAQAALDKVNAHADAAIDCWARFLGVTATSTAQDLRSRIQSALAALYQYRHPDEPEGYKALVAKYTAAP